MRPSGDAMIPLNFAVIRFYRDGYAGRLATFRALADAHEFANALQATGWTFQTIILNVRRLEAETARARRVTR